MDLKMILVPVAGLFLIPDLFAISRLGLRLADVQGNRLRSQSAGFPPA